MKSILEARKVSKSYRMLKTSVKVLDGLDFELAQSEQVAIVGASGVGKSTFLHCLGLLDRADSGEIFFEGHQVNELDEEQRVEMRNYGLGFIFQFHYLISELTALENVMMPLLIRKESAVFARQEAAETLERVKLDHRMDHRPAELSGGEQQRVAIARALVHKPRMILADEPTGNLDPETATQVFDLLIERCHELKAGLVMATHNTELARRLDRVLTMKQGKLC